MDNSTVKYILGQETTYVVEKANFSSSIFSEQYSLALNTLDRYLQNSDKNHELQWRYDTFNFNNACRARLS